MDNDVASSASCRIVVVSSTLEAAKDIASRIKTLAGDDSPTDESLGIINWTIKNKYYTAPVHFQPIHLEGLDLLELDDVPAFIYAWGPKEPYEAHLERINEVFDQNSTKPEVALAISTGVFAEEINEDLLNTSGLEYIDGHRDIPRQTSADFDSSPGLNRAIDALSTIMWPSMTRSVSSNRRVTKLPVYAADGENSLEERTIDAMPALTERETARQREKEKLERWLEEGSDEDENIDDLQERGRQFEWNLPMTTGDPWTTGSPRPDAAEATSDGFDDDFSAFVSGPSGPTTTNGGEKDDNASDQGDDLPDEVDIQAAKARIFGPSRAPDPDASRAPGDLGFAELLNPVESGLDMDAPTFDLSRILGALDMMKAEVKRIPDEAGRRKAAAQVALGLVYGLEEMRDLGDEANGDELVEEVGGASASRR